IVGWRDLIQPSLSKIRLWPFDGGLSDLLMRPGVTVAEIYPAEAYSHLGLRLGTRMASKRSRDARRVAVDSWLDRFDQGAVRLSDAAKSWVHWGFLADDDFDATAGLLSMLLVVTGQRSSGPPDSIDVREIEGWILGQTVG